MPKRKKQTKSKIQPQAKPAKADQPKKTSPLKFAGKTW
jgi:hypothetical protein